MTLEPLQSIQFDWSDGTRLEVEARYGVPSGERAVVASYPDLTVSAVTDGGTGRNLRLAWQPDQTGLFEPLRLYENVDYIVAAEVPMAAQIVAGKPYWPFDNLRLGSRIKLMTASRWHTADRDGSGYRVINGTANFGSSVGVVDLSVAGKPLRAEVATSKVEYFDEFRTLLDVVADEVVDLLFQVDQVSGLRFASSYEVEPTEAVELFHLRRIMSESNLPAAIEQILSAPYGRLVTERTEQPPALAYSIDATSLAASAAGLSYNSGGPLSSLFRGWSPTALPETFRREEFDTPENRYVKAVLNDLLLRFDRLDEKLARRRKRASVQEVRCWRERIEDLLADPLWRDVGELTHIPSNSQVLLRRDNYRQVLQTDLLLREGLVLPWQRASEIAETIADIRPVHELYEYYCFFVLRRVLRALTTGEERQLGDFYLPSKDNLSVGLSRGKSARLRYWLDLHGARINVDLYYNRQFQRPDDAEDFGEASYTTSFRPDLSVHVHAGGQSHWLLFDAKYRLEYDDWLQQLGGLHGHSSDAGEEAGDGVAGAAAAPAYAESLGGPQDLVDEDDRAVFKKVDLYKMHSYRDAIIGTRGAYVLYPGQGSQSSVFVRHTDADYRAAYSVPSVGAFAVRPGDTDAQEALLGDFILQVVRLIAASSGYLEEQGLTP